MSFGYYPYQNNNPYQQLAQMQAQQSNSNNFIHVPSEEVARSYAVSPGGSVTFINDNAPYCYTKTAGFSQFDAPIFRKFRLVEETDSPVQNQNAQQVQEQPDNGSSFESISKEVQTLRSRIEVLERQISDIGTQNTPKQNQSVQPQQNERRAKNESPKSK